jgi:hypothetical protein
MPLLLDNLYCNNCVPVLVSNVLNFLLKNIGEREKAMVGLVKISPGDGERSVMRIAAVHAFTSHPPKE